MRNKVWQLILPSDCSWWHLMILQEIKHLRVILINMFSNASNKSCSHPTQQLPRFYITSTNGIIPRIVNMNSGQKMAAVCIVLQIVCTPISFHAGLKWRYFIRSDFYVEGADMDHFIFTDRFEHHINNWRGSGKKNKKSFGWFLAVDEIVDFIYDILWMVDFV